MKIAITGASGFISRNLIKELKKSNHEIISIERSKVYHIDQLAELLSDSDIVINLAGASILRRWTKSNKNEILTSRVDTTRNIVSAINNLPEGKKPATFISASAVGIYSNNQLHSEESSDYSHEFIGEVVKNWENASDNLSTEVRKVVFRIGLILGDKSKTIQNLLPVFNFGLGGKIGNGEQPFPFIHVHDVIRAFTWSIENKNAIGIYNLVAPENIDNKKFTQTLAKTLKRPAFFFVPEFILKLALGEVSTLLLQSPQVSPERLLKEGFTFNYPDIKSCLAEICQ